MYMRQSVISEKMIASLLISQLIELISKEMRYFFRYILFFLLCSS